MVYKGNKHCICFIRWDQCSALAFFDVWNSGLRNCFIRFWILTALVVFKVNPICLFTVAYKLYAIDRKCNFNSFFSPSEHWVQSPSVQIKHGIKNKQTKKSHTKTTLIFFPIMSKIWHQYVCVLPDTGGSRCYLTDCEHWWWLRLQGKGLTSQKIPSHNTP